uniref:Hsp70 family protein n=1 Tax=Anaerosporobacter sp. TaxID=1872529 RepID=UPI00286ED6DC
MIIGIDLGTTNSLVSYFTEEGPKIIPNRLNNSLTPSIVAIDNGQVFVGETAREKMLLSPDKAASVFKRNMGNNREYTLEDKVFTAEELSSFILKALKEDAEVYLNQPITEAVISVPAYFNDKQRKSTKRAGELAGLKVERIISEPTAAAIAYGLYEQKEDAKLLVFDLGGGTFDVSILELFDSIVEVRAVAGDNFLGGEDFTQVLVDIIFSKLTELACISLSDKQLKHITKQADRCKLEFSNSDTSTFSCVSNDKEYSTTISL